MSRKQIRAGGSAYPATAMVWFSNQAVISARGGRSFTTRSVIRSSSSLVVCSFPGCTSPRTIGPATFDTGITWTPDGRGIAYAREGNLWVQALSGGAPRQLTRFTDRRPIGSFAWSRDGKRLAVARVTVTNDIVLFQGLK